MGPDTINALKQEMPTGERKQSILDLLRERERENKKTKQLLQFFPFIKALITSSFTPKCSHLI